MDKMTRRDFLKLVGGGSMALAGGAMLSGLGLPAGSAKDALTFRAIAGLPSAPLPNYASYVIEGGVNLATGSGVLTRTVFAGHPEGMSNIALPGLTQVVRVTGVNSLGSLVEIKGEVADSAQLLPGETSQVTVRVDRSSGTVRAQFLGNKIDLRMA